MCASSKFVWTVWHRYSTWTGLYGALHFAANSMTLDVYTHEYLNKKTLQPVLATHHAVKIMQGFVLGHVLWPVMLYDDLTTAECAIRGKDRSKYGSMLGVMFHPVGLD
jgi:hypothetical protein